MVNIQIILLIVLMNNLSCMSVRVAFYHPKASLEEPLHIELIPPVVWMSRNAVWSNKMLLCHVYNNYGTY